MVINLVKVAYLLSGALLLPFFAYLGLVVASALGHRRRAPRAGDGSTRFLIVIPAHDEEASIAATVASCRASAYDRDRFRVLVVADNCTDRTAEVARGAGAEVFERTDPLRRSKGYALEDVFNGGATRGVDAVVVIDADTVLDPDLLAAFDGAIAEGFDWIQCYYTVRNPDASWRTRLMTHAFSLFNGVMLLGQERLGLGAGLKGNGMCFTTRGLDRVPWKAYGLVEDLEFSWRLHALGESIHFLPRARVYGEMVSRRGSAAASQRRRWEAGRRDIPRKYLGAVTRSATLGRYRKVLYSLQLIFPPLVTLAAGFAASASVHPAVMLDPRLASPSRLLLPIHGLMAGVLVAYVLCPVAVMGLPARYLRDLLYAPYYAAWKLLVSVGRAPATWVRTQRESRSRAGAGAGADGESACIRKGASGEERAA